MTPTFRILALAAMGWGAAVSIQAAPTVIDMDFNAQADAAKTAGLPAAVTKAQGFSFSGATVYHQSQVDGQSYNFGHPKGAAAVAVSGAGFIQNRFGNANANVNQRIEVALDNQGSLKGRDIKSVTFSFTNASTAMEFFAYDEAGEHSFTYNPGSSWAWSSQSGDFSTLGVVSRIAFASKADAATFAIDNFRFTLADNGGGGGGSVPEPAGLGLAVLALAAAGVTRRKRQD